LKRFLKNEKWTSKKLEKHIIPHFILKHRIMKRIIKILGLSLLPLSVFSQHFEAGLLLGASNYLGDLSNNSGTVYIKETKPAFGALVRYNFNDMFTARLGLTYTWVAGRDANVKNDDFVKNRNLSFRSNILEFALTGEINIPGYQPYALSRPLSPYLFVGIAATKFNPKTRYQGNWEKLQPLGTEGQGMPGFDKEYGLTSFTIPFGVGVKYALTDKINLGLELGARRMSTDYLDDVSGNYVSYPDLLAGNGELAAALGNRTGELTGGEPVVVPTGTQRGDRSESDWYFILGITVSYNFLDNGLMGGRQRSRRKAGCNN
jgi:opacity protein-like surface antigen